jgi:hypothetical protein
MIQESAKPLLGMRMSAYSTEIVYTGEEFERLSHQARHLLDERCSTSDPHFFLASVQRNIWSPLAVVVSCDGVTVGIVYAKERKIAGFGLGLIYADATLDGMVVSQPAHRATVFEVALRRLIDRRGSRGLRLLIPAAGPERDAIGKLLDSRPLDVHYSPVAHHSVVELGPNYEAFLEKLGKRTRRNFRYYRRRLEAEGHTYVEAVDPAEFERAAFSLLAKDVVGGDRDGILRALSMLGAVKHPIYIGLRHQNGEWLSILGGWRERDYGVVLFQMNNDRDYPQSALCVAMRGYLIEASISAKVTDLLFWGGVGPPLSRYCRVLPATGVHLDSPTLAWRTTRRMIGWVAHFLPQRLRSIASWVAPGVPSQSASSRIPNEAG